MTGRISVLVSVLVRMNKALWSVHTVCLRDTGTRTRKNGLYDIMQNVSHYTGTGTPLFPIVLVPVTVPVLE